MEIENCGDGTNINENTFKMTILYILCNKTLSLNLTLMIPILFVFQKKEWLCLNCQTQRALSGSLGDIPDSMGSSMGSPRSSAPAKQQTPQQKAPNQHSGPNATGPQQQKSTGPQVSGPPSNVKQAGPGPQPKGLSQTSPQTMGSAQPHPQAKSQTHPSSQSKGPTQTEGPKQSHAQRKAPTQSANQMKGPSQAKGQTQTKGSAQPSAQTKGPSHPTGAKPSSGPVKPTPNHTKTPTPSKTVPAQSKPTGNNQARKQPQSQEKTKAASKTLKEDAKASQKKALSETDTTKDMKIAEEEKKSRHHEVSYLQLLRLHLLYLLLSIHQFDLCCFIRKKNGTISESQCCPFFNIEPIQALFFFFYGHLSNHTIIHSFFIVIFIETNFINSLTNSKLLIIFCVYYNIIKHSLKNVPLQSRLSKCFITIVFISIILSIIILIFTITPIVIIISWS